MTQARRFGAEILTTQAVTGVRSEGNTKTVVLTDGSEISARIILIATGAWFRTLQLPGIERWHGAGVYYGAAHTEAANYRDQDVIVIGGANSAAQAMLFLARYARKVTVLIRGDGPDWSHYLDHAIRTHEKVELRMNTELVEIHGDEQVRDVIVKKSTRAGRKNACPPGRSLSLSARSRRATSSPIWCSAPKAGTS